MPRGTNPNRSAESSGRLRSFGIPVLMALVAVGQMIVVEQQALTRWKGGGFGMYTEVHFNHREVWVVRRDGDRTLLHQLFEELRQGSGLQLPIEQFRLAAFIVGLQRTRTLAQQQLLENSGNRRWIIGRHHLTTT